MKSFFTPHLLGAVLLAGATALGQDEASQPEASQAEAAKPAAAPLDPATVRKHASYGFGYRNGSTFARRITKFGLLAEDLDREEFVRGYFDGLQLADSAIKDEDINAALTALAESLKQREEEIATKNKAAGAKFLSQEKEGSDSPAAADQDGFPFFWGGDGKSFSQRAQDIKSFTLSFPG